RQRARLAGAGTAGGAANPLGAVTRRALALVGAEGAVQLEAAGVAAADLARHAVRVGRAGRETAGAVAGERRAGAGVGRDAATGRAAGGRWRVDVVLAALGGANRARFIGAAAGRAVALAVGAATGLALVGADVARIGRARRDG